MKTQLLLAAAVLLALPMSAQQPPASNVEHTQIACIKSNEMPVLSVRINGNGDLRAYFRRTNTTDWCSVDGKNLGQLSTVTLPIFDLGDEIEYFFVVLDGKRVMARSPEIYRVKATERCDMVTARNILTVGIDCTENGSNAIPTSLGAGYAMRGARVDSVPPQGSPDTPAPDQVPPPQAQQP